MPYCGYYGCDCCTCFRCWKRTERAGEGYCQCPEGPLRETVEEDNE
jgi:hypothetical protein